MNNITMIQIVLEKKWLKLCRNKTRQKEKWEQNMNENTLIQH